MNSEEILDLHNEGSLAEGLLNGLQFMSFFWTVLLVPFLIVNPTSDWVWVPVGFLIACQGVSLLILLLWPGEA